MRWIFRMQRRQEARAAPHFLPVRSKKKVDAGKPCKRFEITEDLHVRDHAFYI
jgi:hypothetical protein